MLKRQHMPEFVTERALQRPDYIHDDAMVPSEWHHAMREKHMSVKGFVALDGFAGIDY